jgi:hypothetical protein
VLLLSEKFIESIEWLNIVKMQLLSLLKTSINENKTYVAFCVMPMFKLFTGGI